MKNDPKFTKSIFKSLGKIIQREPLDMSQAQIRELSWSTRSTINNLIDFVERDNPLEKISYSPINDGCIKTEFIDKTCKLVINAKKQVQSEPSCWFVSFFKGFANMFLFRPSSKILYNRIQSFSNTSAISSYHEL